MSLTKRQWEKSQEFHLSERDVEQDLRRVECYACGKMTAPEKCSIITVADGPDDFRPEPLCDECTDKEAKYFLRDENSMSKDYLQYP